MNIRKLLQVLTVLFSASLALVFIGFHAGYFDAVFVQEEHHSVLSPKDTMITEINRNEQEKPFSKPQADFSNSTRLLNTLHGDKEKYLIKNSVKMKPKKRSKKELRILYSSKSISTSNMVFPISGSNIQPLSTKPVLIFDTLLLKKPRQADNIKTKEKVKQK